MATMPDNLRLQLEQQGMPIAASLDDYFRQLTLYGRSALWVPGDGSPALTYTLPAVVPVGEGLTYAAIRRARAILHQDVPATPTAAPLSGSGYYGQSCPREIPDTPLDEWTAGVEALLAATEEAGHDRTGESV